MIVTSQSFGDLGLASGWLFYAASDPQNPYGADYWIDTNYATATGIPQFTPPPDYVAPPAQTTGIYWNAAGGGASWNLNWIDAATGGFATIIGTIYTGGGSGIDNITGLPGSLPDDRTDVVQDTQGNFWAAARGRGPGDQRITPISMTPQIAANIVNRMATMTQWDAMQTAAQNAAFQSQMMMVFTVVIGTVAAFALSPYLQAWISQIGAPSTLAVDAATGDLVTLSAAEIPVAAAPAVDLVTASAAEVATTVAPAVDLVTASAADVIPATAADWIAPADVAAQAAAPVVDQAAIDAAAQAEAEQMAAQVAQDAAANAAADQAAQIAAEQAAQAEAEQMAAQVAQDQAATQAAIAEQQAASESLKQIAQQAVKTIATSKDPLAVSQALNTLYDAQGMNAGLDLIDASANQAAIDAAVAQGESLAADTLTLANTGALELATGAAQTAAAAAKGAAWTLPSLSTVSAAGGILATLARVFGAPAAGAINPRTGLPYGIGAPVTGALPYGGAINPRTGTPYPVDPLTGQPYDPATGLPVALGVGNAQSMLPWLLIAGVGVLALRR